jgi:hypothetical protein
MVTSRQDLGLEIVSWGYSSWIQSLDASLYNDDNGVK